MEARSALVSTETEATLAAIWANILGCDVEKGSDNFFQLGGDSLAVIEMLCQIGEQWGVNLSLALLFESPILSTLAAEIDRCVMTGNVDSTYW